MLFTLQLAVILGAVTALTQNLENYFRHYDIVEHHQAAGLYKRSFEEDMKVTVVYKNVPLKLVLRESGIISSRLQQERSEDQVMHLGGYIEGIVGSSVRVSASPEHGIIQGSMTFGEVNFLPLYIDTMTRYSDSETAIGKSVVYQLSDVAPEFRRKSSRHRLERRHSGPAQITVNELLKIVILSVKSVLKEREQREANTPEPETPAPVAPKPETPAPETKAPSTASPEITSQPEAVAPASPEPESVPDRSRQEAAPQPRTNAANEPKEETNSRPQNQGCRVALFADRSFMENHQNEAGGVQNFLIGLMNQVDTIYESQLGVKFNVDYVGLDGGNTVLDRLPRDPNSIVRVLNDRVQQVINTDDFCTVVVMTSEVLQGSAVGVGFIGTVCDRENNIAVITDNENTIDRPSTLSIITHELGHVFGSGHDGDGNSCGREPSNQRFVMFPAVQSNSRNIVTFSQCSLEQILRNVQRRDILSCVLGNGPADHLVGQARIAQSNLEADHHMVIDY